MVMMVNGTFIHSFQNQISRRHDICNNSTDILFFVVDGKILLFKNFVFEFTPSFSLKVFNWSYSYYNSFQKNKIKRTQSI